LFHELNILEFFFGEGGDKIEGIVFIEVKLFWREVLFFKLRKCSFGNAAL
jgi:hypothetical protein